MVLAALALDDRHLVSATVLQNLRSHLAAGDVWRTDLDVGAGTYHQHLVKADAFAGRHVEFFEPQHFAFRNAMLLAATFNYRIHVKHSEFASWTLVSEPLVPPTGEAVREGRQLYGKGPSGARAGYAIELVARCQ